MMVNGKNASMLEMWGFSAYLRVLTDIDAYLRVLENPGPRKRAKARAVSRDAGLSRGMHRSQTATRPPLPAFARHRPPFYGGDGLAGRLYGDWAIRVGSGWLVPREGLALQFCRRGDAMADNGDIKGYL